jgi:hypothetical protein
MITDPLPPVKHPCNTAFGLFAEETAYHASLDRPPRKTPQTPHMRREPGHQSCFKNRWKISRSFDSVTGLET